MPVVMIAGPSRSSRFPQGGQASIESVTCCAESRTVRRPKSVSHDAGSKLSVIRLLSLMIRTQCRKEVDNEKAFFDFAVDNLRFFLLICVVLFLRGCGGMSHNMMTPSLMITTQDAPAGAQLHL